MFDRLEVGVLSDSNDKSELGVEVDSSSPGNSEDNKEYGNSGCKGGLD